MRLATRVLMLGLFACGGPAAAATIVVTTTNDDYGGTPGSCSLREAVRAATIDAAFDGCSAGAGLLGDTLLLTAAHYELSRPPAEDPYAGGELKVRSIILAVEGAAGGTTLRRLPESFGVFSADSATLRLENLRFTENFALFASDTAVALQDVSLEAARFQVFGRRPATLRDVQIRGMTSRLAFEGPVDAQGLVAIDAGRSPSCAINVGPGSDLRRLAIEFRNDGASDNVYCAVGFDAIDAAGTSVVDGISVTGPGRGSGLRIGHAAVVRNYTASGGRGPYRGLVAFPDAQGAQLPVRLDNVTIVRNRGEGTDAAAILVQGVGDGTRRLTIANSIIGENSTSMRAIDIECDGAETHVDTRGHNLFGAIDAGCIVGGDVGEDRQGSELRLLPLFDSGGGLMTHALLPDSPARGFGDPSGPDACAATDARGYARLPTTCSAGAYEARDNFVVDTVEDAPDAVAGDLSCDIGSTPPRCSLRAALQTAAEFSNPITIRLAADANYRLAVPGAGDDVGASGDLDVRGNGVILMGHGPARTRISMAGANRDRVFEQFAIQFALAGVRVSGGRANVGAGVFLRMPYDERSRFLAYDVRIDGNQASASGHAIAHPSLDAVAAVGAVRLERVSVVDNGAGVGATIASDGHLDLVNSVVARNLGDTAAISSSLSTSKSLDLDFSTVVDNVGGGISFSPARIRASIVDGNTALDGSRADCVAPTSLQFAGYGWLGSPLGCGDVDLGDGSNAVGAPAPLADAADVAGHLGYAVLRDSGLDDAIALAACVDQAGRAVTEDLVGASRVAVSSCDIGALSLAPEFGVFEDGFEDTGPD